MNLPFSLFLTCQHLKLSFLKTSREANYVNHRQPLSSIKVFHPRTSRKRQSERRQKRIPFSNKHSQDILLHWLPSMHTTRCSSLIKWDVFWVDACSKQFYLFPSILRLRKKSLRCTNKCL